MLLCGNICSGQQIKDIVAYPVHLNKGIDFKLTVPKNYRIGIAAEGSQRPRFFAKAPDGRLFITDMKDRSDNKQGRVIIQWA